MSYGLEQYGLDAYGSNAAALSGFGILRAVPVATHVVRMHLSEVPQSISSQLPGDVLNPLTWQIIRTDTGVGFTILEISPTPNTRQWDIRVLEPLASSNITHQVATATLIDELGGPLTDPPSIVSFAGILDASLSTPERTAANQKFAIRDLNNPQAALPSGSSGGVYTIGQDGDYQLHGGTDFVRKLIFRRLMTTPGAFRFLPNFGVGLRVKEPLPSGDLITLQKEISEQVKLEPEVDKVRVSVAQNNNQLTVVVQARLKLTGQQISVPFITPFGANF